MSNVASLRVPKYRRHKASGQALVEIRGKRIYLGKFGSPQSKEKYRQIIAEFMSPSQEPCRHTSGANGSSLLGDLQRLTNPVTFSPFRIATSAWRSFSMI